MLITDIYADAFKHTTAQVCAQVTEELKAEPQVTKVAVENQSLKATFKAKVRFTFAEARVFALLDLGGLRPDNFSGGTAADIIFKGVHPSVASMIEAVRREYVGFLKELAKRIVTAPVDVGGLNRKQIVLLRQSELIDAGFNAECHLKRNGDFYITVTHDACKSAVLYNHTLDFTGQL